jgi:DUF1680 family protein
VYLKSVFKVRSYSFTSSYIGALRERVALRRGPLIYCLEGVDNPAINDPVLPAEAQFQASYRPDVLGGVVILTAKEANGNEIVLVPYYAWDNRAPERCDQDWLLVWLKQEDWFRLRQPLDRNDLQEWQHRLYRPFASHGEE